MQRFRFCCARGYRVDYSMGAAVGLPPYGRPCRLMFQYLIYGGIKMAVTIEIERKTRSRVWELAALMGESHEEAIDAAVRERLGREKIRLRDQKGDEVARTRQRCKSPSSALCPTGDWAPCRSPSGSADPSSVEIGEYLIRRESRLPKSIVALTLGDGSAKALRMYVPGW